MAVCNRAEERRRRRTASQPPQPRGWETSVQVGRRNARTRIVDHGSFRRKKARTAKPGPFPVSTFLFQLRCDCYGRSYRSRRDSTSKVRVVECEVLPLVPVMVMG